MQSDAIAYKLFRLCSLFVQCLSDCILKKKMRIQSCSQASSFIFVLSLISEKSLLIMIQQQKCKVLQNVQNLKETVVINKNSNSQLFTKAVSKCSVLINTRNNFIMALVMSYPFYLRGKKFV